MQEKSPADLAGLFLSLLRQESEPSHPFARAMFPGAFAQQTYPLLPDPAQPGIAIGITRGDLLPGSRGPSLREVRSVGRELRAKASKRFWQRAQIRGQRIEAGRERFEGGDA